MGGRPGGGGGARGRGDREEGYRTAQDMNPTSFCRGGTSSDTQQSDCRRPEREELILLLTLLLRRRSTVHFVSVLYIERLVVQCKCLPCIILLSQLKYSSFRLHSLCLPMFFSFFLILYFFLSSFFLFFFFLFFFLFFISRCSLTLISQLSTGSLN